MTKNKIKKLKALPQQKNKAIVFLGKKGLGVGQVFVYIVAALTFALIMIFGYKVISEFIPRGEEVQFLQFKNELEGAVRKIYSEYGSVREKTFRLPGKYEQICFVDFSQAYNPALCSDDAVACSFWKDTEGYDSAAYDNAAENVFLKPAASQQIKLTMFHLVPAAEGEDGFLCVKITQGAFTLRLEGRGDSTQVSLP